MQNLTLLSYSYMKDDFNLLFYDKQQERLVSVPSDENYLPYLLTRDQKIPKSKKIVRTDFIKRYDGVRHKEQIYKKVCVGYAKPNDIKYVRKRLRNSWEDHILFHLNYAYDKMLIYGCEHQVNDSEIQLPFSYENDDLESFFGRAFEQELVNYKRCALDIEVEPEDEDKVPDPFKAEQPVLEIAIVGSDGKKYVLLLDTEDKTVGNLEYFSNEGDIFTRCFEILEDYPFVITLNGDGFDLPYIFNRSKKFKVETPIFKKRDYYTLKNHIHIDIMKFYQNRSIKTYVFKDKYKNATLEELSYKLLNKHKYPMPDLKNCTPEEIAYYGVQDAKLELELTTFNNNLTMNILTMLCRIANMDMELVNRKPISTWIRSYYQFFHRILNYIIPNEQDFKRFNLKHKGSYKGAIVLDPNDLGTVGGHFRVFGVDFSSLYTSCIEVNNISYDTVNCGHEECKSNKVPDTDVYICTKRDGILKKIFATLTHLRIHKYKKELSITKSEEKKNWLEAIVGTLKVILNAGYGCFSSDTQVFTVDGIKNIREVKIGDEVYTLNPKTFVVETSKIVATQCYDFEGDMIGIKGRHIDLIVTPDHRFYVTRNKSKQWCWVLAEELSQTNRVRLPPKKPFDTFELNINLGTIDLFKLTNLPTRTKGEKIKYDNDQSKWFQRFYTVDDFLRFIAWYLTEGNIHINKRKEYPNGNVRGVNHQIHIYQDRLQYRREIRSLLQRLKMRFSEPSSGGVFNVSNRMLVTYIKENFGSGAKNKHLNNWIFSLPLNLRKIFLEELLKGDGRRDGCSYRTVSLKLAIDVFRLVHSVGYSSNIYEDSDCYTVAVNKKYGGGVVLKRNNHFYKYSYSDKVYCFTTSRNHIILAGRNHKFQWVGQCFGDSDLSDLFAYDVVRCIPAYGRYSLLTAMEETKKMGGVVLSGHTDSIFCEGLSREGVEELSRRVSEKLNIDFEIQGYYKFASFWRKGNYLTVEAETDKIRVAGLMGKKSHMGAYFKQRFEKLKDLIKTIEDEETLKNVKSFLQKLAKNSATDINDEKVPLEDLAFEIKIHKNPDEGSGQYYEVAKMLNNNGYEVKAGDTIRFIPTLTEGHSAMPLQMIKDWNIVNKGKLVELLANVMNQVMVPLGLDAHVACQGLKESKLSDFS